MSRRLAARSRGGGPLGRPTPLGLPVAWGVRQLPVSAPRLQLAFYLVYPLHLALIGALKTLTGG